MKQIENFSDAPQVVQDRMNEVREAVIRDIAMLDELVEPNLKVVQLFLERPCTSYEDDGNTQTPGTQFMTLFVVPIGRKLMDNWNEYMSWYNNTRFSAVYFWHEVQIRDSDNRYERRRDSSSVSVAGTFNVGNSRRIQTFFNLNEMSLGALKFYFDQALEEAKAFQAAKKVIESTPEEA